MSDATDDKIAGFIPKSKYVTITYYLILASMAVQFINMMMAMNQAFSPLMVLGSIAGLLGLLMAVLGYFVFKNDLTALDRNHLGYIGIMFVVVFVANGILTSIFMLVPVMMMIASMAVYAIGGILFFTGLNSYNKARTITKDNLKSEVQLALKRD